LAYGGKGFEKSRHFEVATFFESAMPLANTEHKVWPRRSFPKWFTPPDVKVGSMLPACRASIFSRSVAPPDLSFDMAANGRHALQVLSHG